MEELLNKVETLRKNSTNKTLIPIIIGGAILAIGLLIFFIGFSRISGAFGFVGMMLMPLGAIVLGIGSLFYNKNKSKLKDIIVNEILKEENEEARYMANGSLNIGEVYESGLVDYPDRYTGEDYFSGVYQNVKYKMSELNLMKRVVYRDSNGHTQTRYETYFDGVFLIFDYPKHLDCDLRLLPNSKLLSNSNIESESIEFNKTFSRYTSNSETVFKLLTPVMIQKILEFNKIEPGVMSFYFSPDKLYISINRSRDFIKISPLKPIDQKIIDSIRRDLLIPKAIINEFKFDTKKFQ